MFEDEEYGGSIYSYHPFDDFPSHKPPFIVCVCVPLFSDLFLEFFPLIDDFPIKPPCLLEMELQTNKDHWGGSPSCRPQVTSQCPWRRYDPISTVFLTIAQASVNWRHGLKLVGNRRPKGHDGNIYGWYLGDMLHGYNINDIFVKLVALQGLIVLKAGCAKHGWEVHGLPHVVSDFGVSWRLAHLIETMLRWCWANLLHNLSFSVQTKPVLFAKSNWWNGSLPGVIWIWSSRAHGQLNFKAPLGSRYSWKIDLESHGIHQVVGGVAVSTSLKNL